MRHGGDRPAFAPHRVRYGSAGKSLIRRVVANYLLLLALSDGFGSMSRLIEIRTRTVHNPQVDFFTLRSLFRHDLATASIP